MLIKTTKKAKFVKSHELNSLIFSDYNLFIKKNITLLGFFNDIYGLSHSTLHKIFIKMGYSFNYKIQDVSLERINEIILFFDSYILSKRSFYIKEGSFLASFQFFSNYKGFRQTRGLPSRGQRTSSNAKSCRSLIFHRKILELVKYFTAEDE